MKKNKKIFKLLLIVLVIFLVTGCETIDDLDFGKNCLRCEGDVFFPSYLVKFCANLYQFIQLMTPVILIIMGMVDLLKAVIASEEKQMITAKSALIKKFVAGIMIYLIFAIVSFAFKAVPDLLGSKGDVGKCISHFINGDFADVYCPERINGNGVSVADNETGYTPQEVVDNIKHIGTITECSAYDNDPNGCKNNMDSILCEYKNGLCRPQGYFDNEKKWHCYVCVSDPTGSRRRTYVDSLPGGGCQKWEIDSSLDGNAAGCKNDENMCWKCMEDNDGHAWHFIKSVTEPTEYNGTKVKSCSAVSTSKCENSESDETKNCWVCQKNDVKKYIYANSNPASDGFTCSVSLKSADINKCKNNEEQTIGKCWYCEYDEKTYKISVDKPTGDCRNDMWRESNLYNTSNCPTNGLKCYRCDDTNPSTYFVSDNIPSSVCSAGWEIDTYGISTCRALQNDPTWKP